MAAPKKPVKTSAAKPATSVAAKRSVPKKSSGSTRKKKKIGFGAIVSALLIGKRKWVTMAAFVLVFGGIGAYLVNNSFALHDQNDFGCQYSQQNTLPRVYSKTSPGPGVADPCVALIQDTLKYVWGHTVITTIDGKFGTQTDKAVREFQSRHVHALTADGIVGSNTWKHLKETSTYRTTSRIGSTSASSNSAVSSGGSSGRVFPVANKSFVTSFSNSHPYAAVDIMTKATGVTVVAMESGTVKHFPSDTCGLKNVEIYNSARNEMVTYMHMNTRSVSIGQTVLAGQAIGTVGNCNGAHLHIDVHAGSALRPTCSRSGGTCTGFKDILSALKALY